MRPEERGTVVLGCGTYRIGSSVEFDHGSVLCMRTIKESGGNCVMINCNPETVSTDYDESDRCVSAIRFPVHDVMLALCRVNGVTARDCNG